MGWNYLECRVSPVAVFTQLIRSKTTFVDDVKENLGLCEAAGLYLKNTCLLKFDLLLSLVCFFPTLFPPPPSLDTGPVKQERIKPALKMFTAV